MNQLMNSIDAIKQKITDAEYKQLCDQMMELNTQRKTTEKFYRVWYVITKTWSSSRSACGVDYEKTYTQYFTKVENRVIKLEADFVEEMRRDIVKNGSASKTIDELEELQSLPVIANNNKVDFIDPVDEEAHTVIRIDDLE